MKLNEIKELIDKVNETGIGELKLERADFKLSIRSKTYIKATQKSRVPVTQMMPAAVAANPVLPAAAPTPPTAKELTHADATDEALPNNNLITIKAPMIGTFYRSTAPDKPPFIKVGDTISVGDTICIIEAMKLFNEIESEVSGKVVKIIADDASPVEYDQAMMLIEPT